MSQPKYTKNTIKNKQTYDQVNSKKPHMCEQQFSEKNGTGMAVHRLLSIQLVKDALWKPGKK